MSLDLLGAFGETATETVRSEAPAETSAKSTDEGDDEDDFGDFEEARNDGSDLTLQNELGFVDVSSDKTRDSSQGHTLLFDAEAEEEDYRKQLQEAQNAVASSARPKPNVRLLPREQKADGLKLDHTNAFHFDEDEQWAPVDVSQNIILPKKAPKAPPTSAVSPPVSVPTPSPQRSHELEPAPTNTPPPSMLLSLVAETLQSLPRRLSDILKASESSDQKKISELHAQIAIVRSGARIIAGRKLRWKRDTLLSQSMRIGEAGHGGMKLSSVDKNEARREDQEVAEVVHIWRRQIGPLRTLIAKAIIQLHEDGLMLPDLAEMIPIRQAKPGEGAVKASRCCFLCGINRDERTAKVDLFVEDSFGEWWIEHWGHADCVTFWNEKRSQLHQR